MDERATRNLPFSLSLSFFGLADRRRASGRAQFFPHFWADDDAVKLAKGLHAALDQTKRANK